jgi:N-acetylglucosamine kinase-like BadF-type ATPase
MSPPAAILAVDGGNSKAELVLAAADGTLLAHRRGPTVSHQSIESGRGLRPPEQARLAMERLADMARGAMPGGIPQDIRPIARLAVLCTAGADFPSDERLLRTALGRLNLADELLVFNDAFAPLRAGTDRPYGISVICGAGVNAAAIAPDGRTARYPALGAISGDWGGSSGIGMAGLKAAVRARDGRGPATSLADLVPAHFGVARPATLTRRLYDGAIDHDRLRELSPVVFAAAIGGDTVARGIVDRLADELATMAIALARRLRMTRAEVDVVLAGGVFSTTDVGLMARMRERIGAAMPRATVRRLEAPPVLGAALLALDHLPSATSDAERRLRDAIGTSVPG